MSEKKYRIRNRVFLFWRIAVLEEFWSESDGTSGWQPVSSFYALGVEGEKMVTPQSSPD